MSVAETAATADQQAGTAEQEEFVRFFAEGWAKGAGEPFFEHLTRPRTALRLLPGLVRRENR